MTTTTAETSRPEDEYRVLAGFAHDVTEGRYPVVPDPVRAVIDARALLTATSREYLAFETPAAAVDAVATQLVATGELPDGYAERIFDAEAGNGRAESRSNALHRLSLVVERDLPNVVAKHRDTMLLGLRDQLSPLIDSLRSAYTILGNDFDLDHPDGEVVANMDARAHAALRSCIDDSKAYRVIRGLQFALHAVGGITATPGSDEWQTVTWKDTRNQGVLDLSDLTEPGLPTDDRGRRCSVRAVVSRPDVWLPTTNELEDAWAKLIGTPRHVLGVNTPSVLLDPARPSRGSFRIGE